MKKLILFLCFIVLINSVIAEQETIGPFAQNEIIEIPQTCSNCTSVNITSIAYPNSSIAITNVEMTKDGTRYNYTFNLTEPIGDYIVSGVGDVDGIPTVFSFDFKVTKSGAILTQPQSNVYLIATITLILIGLLMFILSWVFEHPGVKVFFFGFGFLIVIVTIGINTSFIQNSIGEFEDLVGITNGIYKLATILAIGGGVALMLWLIIFAFVSFNRVRGLSPESDDDFI